jgi:hypothetical protein
MIRSALFLCAAIIVAACFACMPGPQPMTPEARAPATACNFPGNISYVTASFAPLRGGPGPTTNSSWPSSPDYRADLIAAFSAASPAFQQQLCSLDAIYVNAAPCTSPEECFDNSWGWRQSKPTVGQGRLISLSTALWQSPKYSTYSSYETVRMQTTLPLTGAAYSGAQSCSPPGTTTTCTNVDNFTMVLLATLAHEAGHILWYDKVDPGFPDTKPIAFTCPDGGSFFGESWALSPHHPPAGANGGEWRELSTPGNRTSYPDLNKYPPQMSAIDRVSGYSSSDGLISQLFAPIEPSMPVPPNPPRGQPWASALGATSPDEDFVETYEFEVLTTAKSPLTSVTLTIPTSPQATYNIPMDYFQTKSGSANSRPELVRKVACIPTTFWSPR